MAHAYLSVDRTRRTQSRDVEEEEDDDEQKRSFALSLRPVCVLLFAYFSAEKKARGVRVSKISV